MQHLPSKMRKPFNLFHNIKTTDLLAFSGQLTLVLSFIHFAVNDFWMQEEFEEGDELGKLNCGHGYHMDCIKQWLGQKNTCPVCKSEAVARS